MTTSEKVAYLKGLVEGFGMADPETKEGKVLATILDILEDLALDVDDLDASIEELNEGLDVVSDDLEDVENIVYDEWDDDDAELWDDDDEDDEDDEELFYEVTCPECGDSITFDEAVLDSGCIECPGCGAKLEFDLDDLDDIEVEVEELDD